MRYEQILVPESLALWLSAFPCPRATPSCSPQGVHKFLLFIKREQMYNVNEVDFNVEIFR
jgi:hypothetical protein